MAGSYNYGVHYGIQTMEFMKFKLWISNLYYIMELRNYGVQYKQIDPGTIHIYNYT